MTANLTTKRTKEIAKMMRDLGYKCSVKQVEAVRAGKTIEGNAALAANIIHELDARGIKHEHEG